MPTVDWNHGEWDERYGWDSAGDEWSESWGGTEAQWLTCVFPRVFRFLPTGTIVEIAPGYGRWTQFLLGYCESFIGVDLSEQCIDACKKRFSEAGHAQFVVNDGLSLAMVADRSVDFVFSFDSLVHVEDDVIGSYLGELSAKLTDDGVAFIHHSNIGAYRAALTRSAVLRRLSNLVPASKRILGKLSDLEWHENRGRSMTAERFVELSHVAGLACVSQEIINWSGPRLIDCISLLTRPGSKWDRPFVIERNPNFGAAALSSAAAARTSMARPKAITPT